jgi:hypothetical protein
MSHSARSHAAGADVPFATGHLRGSPTRSSSHGTAGASSERPGQPRLKGRRLPPFGHRDQAFTLRLFPGSFARAPDGFCLLAGFAFGRFFVRLATLHLTKNALALHLLFERPEGLFEIVVANEYLQKFSNRGGTPRGERLNQAKLEYRGSTQFSQGLQECHVDRRQRSNSLDNPTNKAQHQPSPARIRNSTGAGGRETARAPACNHRSVTCGKPYSVWPWPRRSASAWQPLLRHTANNERARRLAAWLRDLTP